VSALICPEPRAIARVTAGEDHEYLVVVPELLLVSILAETDSEDFIGIAVHWAQRVVKRPEVTASIPLRYASLALSQQLAPGEPVGWPGTRPGSTFRHGEAADEPERVRSTLQPTLRRRVSACRTLKVRFQDRDHPRVW
jgi:hypothetical protein